MAAETVAEHRRPEQGAALIISMLVVVALTVSAFGTSRIFLSDVRTAGSLEDTLASYYLAEAGVEEGLLRYRVDRTNAAGLNDTGRRTPVVRTVGDGRYEMTTNFLARAFTFGDPADDCPGEEGCPDPFLAQDKTLEVPTMTDAGVVEISWQWVGPPPGSSPDRQCGVEITDILDPATDPNFRKEVVPTPQDSGVSVPAGGRTAIRLKPLCDDLDEVRFEGEGANSVGRPRQTIEATGTAGGAKRKLRAEISRRRGGQLVGFFDFVLLSESDLCQPSPCS